MNGRIIAACAEAGFRPVIAHYVQDFNTALGLVASGLGVSLIPESLIPAGRPNVIFKSLEYNGSILNYDLVLVKRDSCANQPAADMFADLLVAQAEVNPDIHHA